MAHINLVVKSLFVSKWAIPKIEFKKVDFAD